MSKDQPGQTLADYVTIAISPVLIMALVGSLVFFLLEVSYVGDFLGRLRWILFFYVFGIVLASRISMRDDIAGRSGMYGLILAVLVWIGLKMFVEYPAELAASGLPWLINLGLVLLSWWCAHKLTKDCTFIDDDEEASGTGLLQAAGLEGAESAPPGKATAAQADQMPNERQSATWWERYHHYWDKSRRPHTPGVWVVYFSLAALPVFGVGQSLIPPEETGRRQFAFWMMVIYVASGLGLLLTTAFLGLRRYLRQRRLQMPASIAGVWLTVGGLLIVALLLVGALLPRPSAEYALIQLPGRLGSPDRQASRFAVKGDSPGKDQGKPASDAKDKQQGTAGPGEKRDTQGSPQARGDGKQGQSDQRGNQQGGDRDRGRDSGESKDRQRDERQERSKDERQPRSSERSQARDSPSNSDNRGRSERQESEKNQADSRSSGSETRQADPPSAPSEFLTKLGTLLKWIVYILIAVAALYLAWRFLWNFLNHLANFTSWARSLVGALRNFWQSLFGWWGGGSAGEDGGEEFVDVEVVRPFAEYPDPFLTGNAERWPPERVLRYSFEALQAWAREAGCGREPGETPLEFVERVAEETPALAADARRLVGLYTRAAYAHEAVTAPALGPVRRFWERLREIAERPLSAASRD